MAAFEDLHVLPPDWQARDGRISPGDLRHFAPEGFGNGVPLIMRPGDTLDSAFGAASYYGLEGRSADPIRSAPSTLPQGGTIYFNHYDEESGLGGVLRVLAMAHDRKDYAVFFGGADNTIEQRYLDQIRIVGHAALRQLYGVSSDAISQLPTQPLGLRDAVYAFLEHQSKKWGDPRYLFSSALRGTLGGDGDWAKEALAFGLMVENGYWQVFRIWSRPWLVTK